MIADLKVGLEVTVILASGETHVGRVAAYDVLSDLAVVECDANLHAAKIGSSLSLRQGEVILAIGAPLGLANTVTAGVVSALHRTSTEIGLDEKTSWSSGFDYIQVDVPIDEGNSGGPLVNVDGEIVGINAVSAHTTLSYAQPIEQVPASAFIAFIVFIAFIALCLCLWLS